MLQTIVESLNDEIGRDVAASGKLARDAVHVIGDVETLRVIADTTRLKMLEYLRAAPRTVKEIASTLDVPPTKLYYHTRLLEEHGLIKVVETRIVSGIIEKSYQTTAYRFTVDRSLLPGAHLGEPALDVALSLILDEVAGEIRRSMEAGLIDLSEGGRGFLLGRSWVRMTSAQAELFADRVHEAQQEIERLAAETDESGTRMYELLIGVYPTIRGPDNDDGNRSPSLRETELADDEP